MILNSYFFLFLGLAFDAYFNSYFVNFIFVSFCSYSFFYEKWSFILINCLKITRELIKNYTNYHLLVN